MVLRMRNSNLYSPQPIALDVDRSMQQHLLPFARRRTQLTKHYNRASSSDMDAELKESPTFPNPLIVITNRQSSLGEDCFLPADTFTKEIPGLPSLPGSFDYDVKSATTMQPLRSHTDQTLDDLAIKFNDGCGVDEPFLMLTPKSYHLPPMIPAAPHICFEQQEYAEIDMTDAPASIFLPEDI